MSEVSLLDRYRGAMVGVHVGDSAGLRFEGKWAGEITKILEKEALLEPGEYLDPWNERSTETFPAGMPSDDSDQTADLAWSLIECNGLNPDHLREALRDSVIHGKSRLWNGESTGSGKTTKGALSDDPEKVRIALSNNVGTNGSLMRSVPIALWLRGEMGTAEYSDSIICRMSAVTHAHWHSQMSCVIYCHVLSNILDLQRGERLNFAEMMEKSLYRFRPLPLFMRIYYSLFDEYTFPLDPGRWPARGTAEFSLYAALWCFKNSTSFADGIEKAVRIGGDTDTYAAIAGGLLGAYYGYEAIPLEWRQTILGHDVMVDYAEKLYEMNQRHY